MDDLPDEDVQALKAGLPQPHELDSPLQPAMAEPQPSRGRSAPASAKPRQTSSRWVEGLVLLIPRFAVALFMLSMLGAGWLGWRTWEARPSFVQAYQTERGQQRQIELPDGSQLWLDAASRAEVAISRQRRQVVLRKGQAMFSVQANPEQPFDVLAGPLRVTVVGTEFAVRNGVVTAADGSTSGSVRVAVEKGRVRVARRDQAGDGTAGDAASGAVLVELTPGQAISTDAAGQITSQSTTVADAAPWREGRIVFEGATLAEALAEFERYGVTNLVIHDPKVAALRVHGSYSLRGLQAFVDALPQVLPVRLVLNKDQQTEIVLRH